MASIKTVKTDMCYGCSACFAACPKSAITMKSDEKGFYKPYITEEKCVDCSLCLSICPIEKENSLKNKPIAAYGVKLKDQEQKHYSTSGGAFSLFANKVIKDNGVIYAATFSEKKVKHLKSTDYQIFRGSKYVQSDLNDSFKGVISDLKNGEYVMFVGTPCQCGGLKQYLASINIHTDRLIVVDFVCHGTPSPKLLEKYILYVEGKYHKELKVHNFRTKYNGWKSHTEENVFSDGTSDYTSFYSQIFKGIFHSHLGMKQKCFDCGYTSYDRVSDITLADFWGCERSHPEFYDNYGISFVMINSSKGAKLFETVKGDCEFIEADLSDTDQPQLTHPMEMPNRYKQFWADFNSHGFNYIVRKYYGGGIIRRFLSRVYHCILK